MHIPRTASFLLRHSNFDYAFPEFFRTSADNSYAIRLVLRRDGRISSSHVRLQRRISTGRDLTDSLAALYDYAYLRSPVSLTCTEVEKKVRVVDVFSGCGLMSLGISEACRALGKSFFPVLAIDTSEDALRTYKSNFPAGKSVRQDVTEIANGRLGTPFSSAERQFQSYLGHIDIVVGGPPCQGHSNLNNHTRRSDPRNKLYERMARFAEILRPRHLIIENVSDVLSDHGGVVRRTTKHLRMLGYSVDDGVLELYRYGVPQMRKRHFMVASSVHNVNLASMLKPYEHPLRTVRWAIGDLLSRVAKSEFDQPAVPNKANLTRIDYLFNNDCFDLPDSQRPDCHRLKEHSYKSIYGRMHWDKPSQTITSGFGCMGQGRFVHPKRRRTLTPHEAARLQFIPDFFKFPTGMGRTRLAELIANAVPSKIVYVLALELLR